MKQDDQRADATQADAANRRADANRADAVADERNFDAVSYTHLDVYKRQARSLSSHLVIRANG